MLFKIRQMSQHFAVTGILIHDPAIRRQAVHRADVGKLQRHARSAIESYSDDELASLIGTKRMSDYKAAARANSSSKSGRCPSTSRLQAS
jgi:hypothetical protein